MKILLYSRAETPHDPAHVRCLVDALDGCGLPYMYNEGFAAAVASATGGSADPSRVYTRIGKEPDAVVLSYGGDGTLLECAKLVMGTEIPVLGINSGRLGFLANVARDGVRQALGDLKAGRYTTVQSPLVEVSGEGYGTCYAFNEVALQRGGTGMIEVESYVDGEMVATYWGDGVLLATPAGSTAYSLSVGGPVIAPECGCLVLSPIAPHNLTMRPVVLPDTARVEFRVRSRDSNIVVSVDGDYREVPDGSTLNAVKSKKTVFLVRLQNISFYDTLRNKMLWGLDKRDEK